MKPVTGTTAPLTADQLRAAAVGFVDADLLLQLAARRRFTGLIERPAADVADRIGYPDKFLPLLDLSTTPTDWIGMEQ